MVKSRLSRGFGLVFLICGGIRDEGARVRAVPLPIWIKGDLTAPKSNFRSTPESGLRVDIAPFPFRATSGLMQRSK
jgi:hypothetical protein